MKTILPLAVLIRKSLMVLSLSIALIGKVFAAETSPARLDKDFSFSISDSDFDAVLKYLDDDLTDENYYSKLSKEVRTMRSTETFIDIYYDTADLKLLKTNGDLRHRRRYLKDQKIAEWLQLKVANEATKGMEEIKFEISRKVSLLVDQCKICVFPFYVIPKEREQERFQKVFRERLGVVPRDIHHVLTIQQVRNRVYISKDGESYLTVSLDEVVARKWYTQYRFAQLEVELNEIAYSEALRVNEVKARAMEALASIFVTDIKHRFPSAGLFEDVKTKYSQGYEALSKITPFSGLLQKIEFWVNSIRLN